MSHCPGVFLEDYITDRYRVIDEDGDYGTGVRRLYKDQVILNKDQFQVVVSKLEPYRDEIEDALLEYNEEEYGSWRDYVGFHMDDIIPNEIDEWVNEYFRSLDDRGYIHKTDGFGNQ